MRGDLEDNESKVMRITADNVCCVDRGNGYNVAKDKREEAVATSLFLISINSILLIDNIHPPSRVFHYSNNNPQPYTFS